MGTSLTGLTPATTYDALIKVGDNGPIDGTLKTISDGLGNDLPIQVSSTKVNFTNKVNANRVVEGFTSVAASGTQIVLTVDSTPNYLVTGSGGQTFKLPDATTLENGTPFYFNNNQSSGAITVNNNSGTPIASVPAGGFTEITLLSNSIAAGSWERHEQAPSNVSWSTNTFDYPGSITGATWNGVAIADAKIASAATWNAKQDALVSGTNIKTVNSTSILGSGNIAVQDTLVSGTNIKTVNGNSLLGSGNLSISASPSGVAGAIQFSDGSAFSSDATRFFWDDTNKRLGVGTNSPASLLSLSQTIALAAGATNPRIANIAYTVNNTGAQTGTLSGIFLNATETNLNGQTHNLIDLQVGGVSQIKVDRVGALSVATSFGFTAKSLITSPSDGVLKLSNNAGTDFSRLQLGGTTSSFPAIYRNGTGIDFKTADNSAYSPVIMGQLTAQDTIQVNAPTFGNTGNIIIFGSSLQGQTPSITKFSISTYFTPDGAGNGNTYTGYGFYSTINQTSGAVGVTRAIYVNPTLTSAPNFRAIESVVGGAYFNTTSVQASAILQADSITQGFLPPRMTTAQKNAISSPASGLVVYDTTNNAVAYRDATNWGYLSGASQTIAGAGGTVNIPYSSGNIVNLTLTASTTLTFSNAVVGTYILEVIQGGSGSYTLTYPASVKWSGGTAPTLTTTVGKTDIITLFYDGTTYFGTYSLNY